MGQGYNIQHGDRCIRSAKFGVSWNPVLTTMNETRLTSVGILMPPEFPTETHNKVHLCLVKYGNTHPAQRESFGLGWNGMD